MEDVWRLVGRGGGGLAPSQLCRLLLLPPSTSSSSSSSSSTQGLAFNLSRGEEEWDEVMGLRDTVF